ncbi:hypothetical protein AWM70_06980 [Paenibacillus yonginensis]|uniref:Uncharacterized protein n=1 Tax=Paenibacillus yonginensis TaxID=1462996 RepID=A0A1B1MYW7_9BACL|nr:hypothetical protein AWM70_06980 [Paenibacillus yonginensis]
MAFIYCVNDVVKPLFVLCGFALVLLYETAIRFKDKFITKWLFSHSSIFLEGIVLYLVFFKAWSMKDLQDSCSPKPPKARVTFGPRKQVGLRGKGLTEHLSTINFGQLEHIENLYPLKGSENWQRLGI